MLRLKVRHIDSDIVLWPIASFLLNFAEHVAAPEADTPQQREWGGDASIGLASPLQPSAFSLQPPEYGSEE
jgi:hypothetical protein